MTGQPARIDSIDRRIIAELGKDARLSVRQVAELVHISRSAAHTRIHRLVENGVITGFTVTVDREALGVGTTAIVIVTVDDHWPTVSESLAALPFVEKVQALSGDIDILVTVNAPSNEALSETILRRIHAMPGVASTRSYLILEERDGTAPQTSADVWRAEGH